MDGWVLQLLLMFSYLRMEQVHGQSASAPHPHTVFFCFFFLTSTSINNKSTAGVFGGEAGALPYLLRAPLAFVEDVPEDEHYFGPEQPQSGLERSLHLPFPVRLDTTMKRYVVVVVFVYITTLSRSRIGERNGDGWLKKKINK